MIHPKASPMTVALLAQRAEEDNIKVDWITFVVHQFGTATIYARHMRQLGIPPELIDQINADWASMFVLFGVSIGLKPERVTADFRLVKSLYETDYALTKASALSKSDDSKE